MLNKELIRYWTTEKDLELTDCFQDSGIKRHGLVQVCLDDSHVDLTCFLDHNANFVFTNLAITTWSRNLAFLLIKIDENANLATGKF